MTDKKITQLSTITGASTASSDLFEVVDVSDTTMGGSGTNKKITRAELAAAMSAEGIGGTVDVGDEVDFPQNVSDTGSLTGRIFNDDDSAAFYIGKGLKADMVGYANDVAFIAFFVDDADIDLWTSAPGGSSASIDMYAPTGQVRLKNDLGPVVAIGKDGGARAIGFHGTTPVAQGSAIANASGGATVDTQARTAINALLAYLRSRGDIAP